MTKKQLLAVVVGVLVVGAAVVMAVDPGPVEEPEELVSLGELRSLFDSAGGWIALPIPDSKYEAGAIIQVDRDTGVRFLSHLRECGYPPEILEPNVGTLPGLTLDRRVAFGAEILASLPGLEVGPNVDRVQTVGLRVDEMSADAFDFLRLQVWEEDGDNYDRVPEACRRMLEAEDVYVVSEAARVHRATYSLYDSARALIRVNAENLEEFLDVAGGVTAEADAEGRVVITNSVTLAFRRAVRASGGFTFLGPEGTPPETADALVDSLLWGATGGGGR